MSDVQGLSVKLAKVKSGKDKRPIPLYASPFDFDVETIRNATPEEWAAAIPVLQDRAPDLLEYIGEPPC